MPPFRQFLAPLLIAHRGWSAQAPENTLSAFRAALEAGARAIELDVTLSADRQLIVIHDETLERTTTGRGHVREYTLAELRALDAGSWKGEAFRSELLPTLAEVFELVQGRAWVNVEIKPEAYEAHHPLDSIERQVIELVRTKKMQEGVLISSFQPALLQEVSRLAPELALGVLWDEAFELQEIVKLCQDLRAFSFNPNCQHLTSQTVQGLHEVRIPILTYTVNSPILFQQLLEWGVDGVFTDDPPLLQKVVSQFSQSRG